jgi:hypothetical protein
MGDSGLMPGRPMGLKAEPTHEIALIYLLGFRGLGDHRSCRGARDLSDPLGSPRLVVRDNPNSINWRTASERLISWASAQAST